MMNPGLLQPQPPMSPQYPGQEEETQLQPAEEALKKKREKWATSKLGIQPQQDSVL